MSGSRSHGLEVGVRGSNGFTLIELVVTLAVLAIVMAIALPNLGTNPAMARNQARVLKSTLAYARNEAVNQSRTVVVCASSSASADEPECEGSWQSGWVVYVADADDVTAIDRVLRRQEALGGDISVVAGATTVQFDGRGYSNAALEFDFCSASNPSTGRSVILAASGRALTQLGVTDCS